MLGKKLSPYGVARQASQLNVLQISFKSFEEMLFSSLSCGQQQLQLKRCVTTSLSLQPSDSTSHAFFILFFQFQRLVTLQTMFLCPIQIVSHTNIFAFNDHQRCLKQGEHNNGSVAISQASWNIIIGKALSFVTPKDCTQIDNRNRCRVV